MGASMSSAVQTGTVDNVRRFINGGGSVNTRVEVGGKRITPLMFACAQGKTGLVELLLDKGAAVNATDDDGKTPLMYAVDSNQYKIIDLLLNHRGIEKNKKDKSGTSAFIYACIFNSPSIVKLFLNYNISKDEKTHGVDIAIDRDYPAVLQLLFDKGATMSPVRETQQEILRRAKSPIIRNILAKYFHPEKELTNKINKKIPNIVINAPPVNIANLSKQVKNEIKNNATKERKKRENDARKENEERERRKALDNLLKNRQIRREQRNKNAKNQKNRTIAERQANQIRKQEEIRKRLENARVKPERELPYPNKRPESEKKPVPIVYRGEFSNENRRQIAKSKEETRKLLKHGPPSGFMYNQPSSPTSSSYPSSSYNNNYNKREIEKERNELRREKNQKNYEYFAKQAGIL